MFIRTWSVSSSPAPSGAWTVQLFPAHGSSAHASTRATCAPATKAVSNTRVAPSILQLQLETFRPSESRARVPSSQLASSARAHTKKAPHAPLPSPLNSWGDAAGDGGHARVYAGRLGVHGAVMCARGRGPAAVALPRSARRCASGSSTDLSAPPVASLRPSPSRPRAQGRLAARARQGDAGPADGQWA